MDFASLDPLYIAIIGDLKKSRKVENRYATQECLKHALGIVNETYVGELASKFMITLGDEFQGVLVNGSHTMRILEEITRTMHPVEIRFGLGIGTLTTKIDPEMAIGADGPAYYKAREAIDFLKENEKKKQTSASRIRIGIMGENQETEGMLNTIFSLLNIIEDAWSDRQREVIGEMLVREDSQINLAKRLSIKQPTVQKMLASGHYYTYKETRATIENVLGEIRRNHV